MKSNSKPNCLRRTLIVLAPCLVLAVGWVSCVSVKMPGRNFTGQLPSASSEQATIAENLETHIGKLAGEIGARNVTRYEALKKTESYLEKELTKSGWKVRHQTFESRAKTVRNFDVELPGTTKPDEIVIVGAHYDTAYDSPGANDNTSGTAGLLELARLIAHTTNARTLRLALFVNEEPPYFRTEEMGSRVYARKCKERDENIVAMISLETIGYYTDARNSQKYPPPLSLIYPSTGDFIGFVGNPASSKLVKRCIKIFREAEDFPTEGIAAPGSLPGIGWSDHWSFWQEGYPAIMLTDTAPFRYPYYHKQQDTPDKIDPDRIARIVTGMQKVVNDLLNR